MLTDLPPPLLCHRAKPGWCAHTTEKEKTGESRIDEGGGGGGGSARVHTHTQAPCRGLYGGIFLYPGQRHLKTPPRLCFVPLLRSYKFGLRMPMIGSVRVWESCRQAALSSTAAVCIARVDAEQRGRRSKNFSKKENIQRGKRIHEMFQ